MKRALFALSLAMAGCTLVTGAGDYEVDPEKEQQVTDTMLLSMTRDLDYSFAAMDAHASTPVDIAVVNANDVMQARARIIMPRSVEGEYPTERLVMTKALTPGEQRLFFYADSDGDNAINTKEDSLPGFEHIWIEPVPPSGQGLFTHSTNFIFFVEGDFTTNEDLVLERPIGDLPIGADEIIDCFTKKFRAKFQDAFEVKISLKSEGRQVGYFKMYAGTPLPKGFEIKLPGIIDSGSEYSFDVLFDGVRSHGFDKTAPEMGPMRVAASEWLNIKLAPTDCR